MCCRPREHYVACQSHSILVANATLFVVDAASQHGSCRCGPADKARVTEPGKTNSSPKRKAGAMAGSIIFPGLLPSTELHNSELGAGQDVRRPPWRRAETCSESKAEASAVHKLSNSFLLGVVGAPSPPRYAR